MLDFLLFLVATIMMSLLLFQLKKRIETRQIAETYKQPNYSIKKTKNIEKMSFFQKPAKFLEEKINYTGKYSIQSIVTIILILMISGSIVGLIFSNLFLGFVLAIFLGILPVMHMIKLERKMQILIVKTFPAFLAGLKTEYQLKNRLLDSFVAMEDKVSELIKDDYKIFVSQLDQNVELHSALYDLGERTKCIWFFHLGDIADMAEYRQDKAGILRTLDSLSIEIERHIEETNNNQQSISRAGLYVLIMLAIIGFSFYISSRFIENPLIYFTNNPEGRKQMTVGIMFLILPISMYFYRIAKGVK